MIFRFSPSDIEGGETVYCSFQGGFFRKEGDSLEMISIAAKESPNKLAYGCVCVYRVKKCFFQSAYCGTHEESEIRYKF